MAILGVAAKASIPKDGERRSLRKISDELKDAGYLNDRPYNPNSIKLMRESS
jgi:hypothetical protein